MKHADDPDLFRQLTKEEQVSTMHCSSEAGGDVLTVLEALRTLGDVLSFRLQLDEE